MTAEPLCSFEGCTAQVHVRSRGWCRLHYNRWWKHGDPMWEPTSRAGSASHHWLGDAVTYAAAHLRVKRLRGRASLHLCAHCGGRARDWAYDHKDPKELTGPAGPGLPDAPYSADPSHYIPLCKPCHTRFDSFGETCKHGHPRTAENTHVDRRGWRSCKPCRRAAAAAHAVKLARQAAHR